MAEYLSLLLGTCSIAWYAAAFTFVFIGLFIRWSVTAYRGVKTNPESPAKFSWKYWWQNNGKRELLRVLEVIAITFVSLRFCTEWFNVAPSMAVACGIGIGYDLVRYFYRQKAQGKYPDIKPDGNG